MAIKPEDTEMETLKLSETQGMLKIIATAKIKADGVYFCTISGKKIKVVGG
jgi:hypothetical protein